MVVGSIVVVTLCNRKQAAWRLDVVDGGDELGAIEDGLVLLGQRVLDVVTGISVGDEHVHLGGLGRHNVRIERLLAQVDLGSVGLVDAHGGHLAEGLHLDALAVDQLDGADEHIKDNCVHYKRHMTTGSPPTGSLDARVEDDAVDLALDLDRGVGAPATGEQQ